MHALIMPEDKEYYISAVFAHYLDQPIPDEELDSIVDPFKPYWIIWDKDKKKLIRWFDMIPDSRYLNPQILIVDSDQDNWIKDKHSQGCVDFLTKELLESILDQDQQPQDILEKCRAMDAGYTYSDIQEIKTQKDIEDLMWASGGFHDACISKEELLPNGTLYLLFTGTWGCEIEVWFSGDLEYATSSRNPEEYDPYWFGSSVIIQDGFIYFIDDDDMTVEEINDDYCFFKARQMKYHIIPKR